jgi:hypothetical protein
LEHDEHHYEGEASEDDETDSDGTFETICDQIDAHEFLDHDDTAILLGSSPLQMAETNAR